MTGCPIGPLGALMVTPLPHCTRGEIPDNTSVLYAVISASERKALKISGSSLRACADPAGTSYALADKGEQVQW